MVVPDRHTGDFGIEGFSRDGCAYQCYAAREPLDTQALYEKQRDKMSADIRKFCNNQPDLQALFGPTVISRWIFVVPRHDSAKLTQHAETKAAEVRVKGLPYVAQDFAINVITDEYFLLERSQLLAEGLRQIQVPIDQMPEADVHGWADDNDTLVQTLDGKLEPLRRTPEEKTKLRDRFLKHFLDGQNVLQRLKDQYPMLYEVAVKTKESRAEFLRTASLTQNLSISGVLQTYTEEVFVAVKGVDRTTAELLAHGAVAEWLLLCPLQPTA